MSTSSESVVSPDPRIERLLSVLRYGVPAFNNSYHLCGIAYRKEDAATIVRILSSFGIKLHGCETLKHASCLARKPSIHKRELIAAKGETTDV